MRINLNTNVYKPVILTNETLVCKFRLRPNDFPDLFGEPFRLQQRNVTQYKFCPLPSIFLVKVQLHTERLVRCKVASRSPCLRVIFRACTVSSIVRILAPTTRRYKVAMSLVGEDPQFFMGEALKCGLDTKGTTWGSFF